MRKSATLRCPTKVRTRCNRKLWCNTQHIFSWTSGSVQQQSQIDSWSSATGMLVLSCLLPWPQMPGHRKSGKTILHHSNHSYVGNIKPVSPVNSLYSTSEVWASKMSQSKHTQNSVVQYMFPNVISNTTKVKNLASNKWCSEVIGIKTLPIPWTIMQ